MSEHVSVVIPSYNHAPFLKVCLQSALRQTHKDLDVLLVDDCSSDGSFEIAASIKDSRLRVYRNEANLGTYGSQAAGLKLAKGDWIAILDSDDAWAPDKIAKQLEALGRNDGVWCYTLGRMIDEKGAAMPGDPHDEWPRDEVQDLLPHLLNVNRVLASSVMFKKGAVEFRTDLKYCGDWVALLSLAERYPAVCVSEALTDWRQHKSNSYRRSSALTIEEILVRRAILDRREVWLERAKKPEEVSKGLVSCAMALSALYVLAGQMRLARAAAKMATNLGFKNIQTHKRRFIATMPKKIALRRLWPDEVQVTIDEKKLAENQGLLGD